MLIWIERKTDDENHPIHDSLVGAAELVDGAWQPAVTLAQPEDRTVTPGFPVPCRNGPIH